MQSNIEFMLFNIYKKKYISRVYLDLAALTAAFGFNCHGFKGFFSFLSLYLATAFELEKATEKTTRTSVTSGLPFS